jgi:hypothetical protein
MVLCVLEGCRHIMALGGFRRANVVFAVASAVAGSGGIGLDRRPGPGGDELFRPTTACMFGSGRRGYRARRAELGAVAPHAVEDDRELPCHGDLRPFEPRAPCEFETPGLQRRGALDAGEDHIRRLVAVGAHALVAAFRDAPHPIHLA